MCYGDKWYTVDGRCGSQHGGRRCAGKWGDCCSLDGKCGNGVDFCSTGRCYSGKCDGFDLPSEDHEHDWIWDIIDGRNEKSGK